MLLFHDVPVPLSFANKKNKIQLVKLFKNVPKDIIDGTGVVPEDGTGACPVQFFAEDDRSGFNQGGSKNKNETRKFNPVPLSLHLFKGCAIFF